MSRELSQKLRNKGLTLTVAKGAAYLRYFKVKNEEEKADEDEDLLG